VQTTELSCRKIERFLMGKSYARVVGILEEIVIPRAKIKRTGNKRIRRKRRYREARRRLCGVSIPSRCHLSFLTAWAIPHIYSSLLTVLHDNSDIELLLLAISQMQATQVRNLSREQIFTEARRFWNSRTCMSMCAYVVRIIRESLYDSCFLWRKVVKFHMKNRRKFKYKFN